jgi:hypothetical protein
VRGVGPNDSTFEGFEGFRGVQRMSRCFLNLPALNARGAHADAFGCTRNHRPNVLQIQIPSPLGYIVGVTDTIPKLRTAAANFTHFGHAKIVSY